MQDSSKILGIFYFTCKKAARTARKFLACARNIFHVQDLAILANHARDHTKFTTLNFVTLFRMFIFWMQKMTLILV